MTRAQLFALYDEAAEEHLAGVELDLLDQGAPAAHIADRLKALRELFEEHRHAEIDAVAWLLNGTGDTRH